MIGGPVLILAAREPTNDPRVWRGVEAWLERGAEVVVVASCEEPDVADVARPGLTARPNLTIHRVRAGRGTAALRTVVTRGRRLGRRAPTSAAAMPAPPAATASVPATPTPAAPDGRRRPSLQGVPSALFGLARILVRTRSLVNAAASARPVLVHAHDDETWLAGLIAARRAGAPLVLDAHEAPGERRHDWADLASWLHRRFCGPILRRADAVITVNDLIGAHLSRRYGIPTPAVIWSCPRLCPPPPPRERTDALRVLYHGWYAVGRGLETLIEAAARVPGVELRLRGFGLHEDHLREVARSAGLDPDEVFLPPVAMRELVQAAADFDVGANPIEPVHLNYYLSSPNKVFEYMMAGLCIVSSDLPAVRPIVEGAECGLLVPPRDVDAWATALQQLRDDPEQVAEAGRRARQAAETTWNWEHHANRMIALCTGLIRTRAVR